jgi:tRNA threonylcarbamoyladenosine biosynthesis protein TsaB
MNILAFDTSTEYCSAALWRDGQVFERMAVAGQTHSTQLEGMVDAVLADAGLVLNAVDGIAFGEGPGSFTGLRIACAVAQGLAFAAGIPVAGVGTLRAMAAASGATRALCCIDARMHEVYHAAYAFEGGQWREVSAPQVCAPSQVPPAQGRGWTGCGSGFAAHGGALRERLGDALDGVCPEIHPQARAIAALAAPVFAAGQGLPPECAAPVYVRDRVALKTVER